ncbi:MAG: UvrD-helicase domain-containing protein [Treponema sp.]
MIDICAGLNEQQKAAVVIQKNAVIAAGAGSGKTKVLASRYVYLITEKNYQVQDILALTFTSKAAAEMHQRIYRELQEMNRTTDNVQQRERSQAALQNFHQSHIMTLDSFCHKIAQTACKNFGISPDFTIDIRESERLAYTMSLDFFLEHRKNDILQYFLSNHSIEDFVEQFFVKILTHATVSRPLHFTEMLEKQYAVLEADFSIVCAKAEEIIVQMCGLLDKKYSSKFMLAMQQAMGRLPPFPDYTASAADNTELFAFLQAVDSAASIPAHVGNTKDPDVILCKELQTALRKIFSEMLNIYNTLWHKEKIHTLYELCKILQNRYLTEKKRRGIMSFTDIEYLAVDALITDSSLRTFYKNQFKRIMIDEFQDNNSLQRDLLFLLAEKESCCGQTVPKADGLEPERLFFVGDEKQSIYAFRGADVSVFRQLARDLQNSTEVDLNLRTNYRTEPALIAAFNEIFARVFYSEQHIPADGAVVPDYEAEFTAIQSREAVAGLCPAIEIAIIDKKRFPDTASEYLTARETEAALLAEKIKQLRESGTPVYDDRLKKNRPCTWSDFAVLFRYSKHQAVYERFFRAAGIPYISVQQKGLFKDAPLNDIYALLRLSVYPHDRFTYTQVLRSPFVRLSDISVTHLLLTNYLPFDPAAAAVVEPDDAPYFENACALFARLQTYRQTMTNAELITALWHNEAYRCCLLTDSTLHRYLELYDYFFELAVQSDAAGDTLSDFIDRTAAYMQEDEKLNDMEIPLEHSADAVKIMTAHKSKGLEFPFVCIPDCGNNGISIKREDLVFFHNGIEPVMHLPQIAGLSAQKQPLFEKLRDEANAKLLAETKRLLYVAMTRAKVRLIMTGVIATNTKLEDMPEEPRSLHEIRQNLSEPLENKNTAFFKLLLPALPPEHTALSVKEMMPLTKSQAQTYRQILQPITAAQFIQTYQTAAEKHFFPAPKRVIPVTLLEKDQKWISLAENQTTVPETPDELSHAEFGSLVHKALEARFLHTQLPLPPRYSTEIAVLCDSFFASDIGKQAAAALFRKTEYGFISTYNGQTVIGQIDLLFEHNGTLFIVDYKTDRFEEPDRHRMQLIMYKHAVTQLCTLKHFADALPAKPQTVRAFLFYLRTQHTVEIVE